MISILIDFRVQKYIAKFNLVSLHCKSHCFAFSKCQNFICQFNAPKLPIKFTPFTGLLYVKANFAAKILIIAILKQWLLQCCETEASFVYLIFALLLVFIITTQCLRKRHPIIS